MSERGDKLLAAKADLPCEDVPTPEWESLGIPVVRMRRFAGNDKDEWEALMLATVARAKISGQSGLIGVRAAVVTCGARDPATGERLFKAAQMGEVGEQDGEVLDRLCAIGLKLNPSLSEDGRKVLEKNSERGHTGGFFSGWLWLSVARMWTSLRSNSTRNSSKSGAPSSASKESRSGQGATGSGTP